MAKSDLGDDPPRDFKWAFAVLSQHADKGLEDEAMKMILKSRFPDIAQAIATGAGIRCQSERDDYLAETLTQAIGQLRNHAFEYRDERSAVAWLCKILRNHILTTLSRKWRRGEVALDVCGSTDDAWEREELCGAVNDPSDEAAKREVIGHVRDAVNALSGRDRVIAKLLLAEWEPSEIADYLQIDRTRVHHLKNSRIFPILRKLLPKKEAI
jgi:RNA polymerase sigma factor (sigma-70 family)